MSTRRRRRQRNPLLTRILVISLIAHAIALPIAAHFGAFDKLKREFGSSRVVMINTPPVEQPKKKAPEKPKKATKTTERKARTAAQKSSAEQKNLPHPAVVASNASPGGEGNGPTVNPNGTGIAGALPTNPTTPAPTTPKETNPPPPPPVEHRPPAPVETPPPPAPVTTNPTPEPAPKPKHIVEAVTEFAPEPEIPDDLRTGPLDKTLVVEADVDTGGHAINVKIADSTGLKELDDIGLDTARRYRFKPATVNDSPVQQHVRFRIIFKVE